MSSSIRGYASRTGTRRNLDALRGAGWGLFVSAAGVHRHEGFDFVIECGAWSWYQRGLPFQDEPFEKVLTLLGRHPLCEGIVAPDIVCGGAESLALSLSWLDRLLGFGPRVYLPVQPGIAPKTVAAQLGLELTYRADCFFTVEGTNWCVMVEVRLGSSIDVILLAAADAGAGEVFEVQVDTGVFERQGPEYRFWTWDALEVA